MMIHGKEFDKQANKVKSQSNLNSRVENARVQPKSEIAKKITQVKKKSLLSNVQVSEDVLQMD